MTDLSLFGKHVKPGNSGGALAAALWFIVSCSAAAADDMAEAEGEASAGDTAVDTEVSIITPGGATTSSGAAMVGPSVELITGGNSTDGAAKVGRLPVID